VLLLRLLSENLDYIEHYRLKRPTMKNQVLNDK